MRTTAVALICCLLVAASMGAATVTATPPSPSPTSSDAALDATLLQTQEPDNQTRPESIEIAIQSDGDARIVLSKAFPTRTDAERAAFERLAREFENGQHGDLGYSTYEEVVEDVSAEAERGMGLRDAGRHSTREGDVGRLEYRFTWTNFAAIDGDRVTAGDAFRTGDGIWLDGLREDQRLVIRAPDGYSVAESPSGPEIDNDALIWTGAETFADGDLEIVFEESTGDSTVPTTLILLLIGFVAAGVVLVVGWQVASGRSDDRSVRDRVGAAIDSLRSRGDVDGFGPLASGGGAGSSGESEGGTAAVADSEPSAAPDAAHAESNPEPVDPALLSDEEQVEHLLEQNGGRMKQANIVSETGWSNAKVSQLLSRMAEEDRVDKLRIGRENLITLPDVNVTDQE